MAALGLHAETPLDDGVRQTVAAIERTLDNGTITETDVDRVLA